MMAKWERLTAREVQDSSEGEHNPGPVLISTHGEILNVTN